MKESEKIIQEIANAKTYQDIKAISFSHLPGNEYDIISEFYENKRREIFSGISIINKA